MVQLRYATRRHQRGPSRSGIHPQHQSQCHIVGMLSDYLARLALAALIGAVLGAEREYRDKPAGFRTIALICVGSCLFTILSGEIAATSDGDPARIASAIVSGVGFLGAGVIFRRGRRSTGITTAAAIWCAAALGMAAGADKPALAVAAAVIVLAVLLILPPLENLIDSRSHVATYDVTALLPAATADQLHTVFETHGLRVLRCEHGKRKGELTSQIHALGTFDQHAAATRVLIDADWVTELST